MTFSPLFTPRHRKRSIAPCLLCALILAACPAAFARTRVYTTQRTESAPRIDGVIDEPVWSTAEWSGDFIQRDPAEGEPPSAQTAFKILYDDNNLYIAYRAFDPDPDMIASILARRDHFPGDWVEINIDSYNDHRTAFSFTSSVSGTQGDEFVSEDGDDWDANWDPVWEHQARIDDQGWTAEVRIPLSQLRYGNLDEQVWGLQVQRRIYRYEERSTWQTIPKDESGWVSMFGELRGITGIKAQRQIELLPYAVSSLERFETVSGDPFADGDDGRFAGGLDGKIGVTSDLTLDFTVNPDFGQVEADPSQVNLTAFETFFEERRPFFIEGSNIMELRVAPSIAYGTHTGDRLFYSRRIGRQPHYRADWYEEGYVDQPQNTSIAGAFKLTGKTQSGISVGVLESVTTEEHADVEHDGQRREVVVEPLTNYFIGRLQKDYRRGDTRLGGMLTAVNRSITDAEVEFLHEAAYAGGVDFFHYLSERRYYLALNLLASDVRGTEEAILRTQTAPARYYQRPDNERHSVDSTRTALSGHAGSLRIGRPTGKFNFETGAAWRSPGFELNDLGFLRNTDEINQFSWMGYHFNQPFSIFREMNLNFNQWVDFEYGGGMIYQAFNFNTNTAFKNNWRYNASLTRQNERISNYELRGGPSIKMPGDVSADCEINSDSRQPLSFGTGGGATWFDGTAGVSNFVWMNGVWRPNNAIRLEVNPSFSHNQPDMQYVAAPDLGDDTRYIYGHLDQKTFDVSLRLDYALTPALTIQWYAAPFVSAGRYTGLRRVTAPRADEYSDRYELLGADLRFDAEDDAYYVDEDGDGTEDYSFDNRDFNLRDFNSNLVIRWQYRPGSSLYLVWSQARSDLVGDGSFALSDDLDTLFGTHPHNVFLVKVNYWFNL